MLIQFKRHLDRQVEDLLAFAAVRSLLNGQTRAARDLAEDAGRWQPLLNQLFAAHRSGGDPATLVRFRKLRQENDAFEDLLAAYMEGAEPARRPQFLDDLFGLPVLDKPYFIPGLLPGGLSILAGRPKIGKSWLTLQFAVALAACTDVLGFPTAQPEFPAPVVFYYALEDSPRRIAERLARQGVHELPYVGFYTECRPLDGPGFQCFAESVHHYDVIIIDTFARALSPGAANDPATVADTLQRLQRLAQQRNAAILLVDHHRKPAHATRTTYGPAANPAANPIDDILGGTAKAGIIDAAIGLYRNHGADTALLRVSGRDLPELELRLQWDPATCTWSNCGDNTALTYTERQQEILDALATLGPTSLGPLAAYTGQDKPNLCHRLQKLTAAGAVTRLRTDRNVVLYARPGDTPPADAAAEPAAAEPAAGEPRAAAAPRPAAAAAR